MGRQVSLVVSICCGLTGLVRAEVTFEWEVVGNPGNAADTTGFGSVGNEYRIAKHEVTNDEYALFLNAVATTDTNGLFNTNMESDSRGGITQNGASPNFTYAVKVNMGNKPVIRVSFFNAMRFVNWLHNGQPTGHQDAGTTEDGVYALSDGDSATRAANAQYFIPSENEWYKAAYYHPVADGGPPPAAIGSTRQRATSCRPSPPPATLGTTSTATSPIPERTWRTTVSARIGTGRTDT